MAKELPTIREVMETLKPATSIKEVLDLFNKLVKYPEYYSQHAVSYSKKNGDPNYKTKPTFATTLNIDTDIKLSKAFSNKIEKEINKTDGLFEYKGKLYFLNVWNDSKENYHGIYVSMVKPIKLK